jgi:bacillolysin
MIWWVNCDELVGTASGGGISDANLDKWKSRGVDGFALEGHHLYGAGGTQQFTGDASNLLSERSFDRQRRIRDSRIVERLAERGMKAYYSFYLVNRNNTSTPLANWFDDVAWANTVIPAVRNVAAMAKLYGMAGVGIDAEMYGGTPATWEWDYPGYGGYTQAQIRAKARQRGREFMQAILQGYPGAEIFWYRLELPGSWLDYAYKLQGRDYYSASVMPDFWDGMSEVPGASAIRFYDHTFFKSTRVSGVSWDAAMNYNSNAFHAILSSRWPGWNYYASRFHVTPLVWIDKGVDTDEIAQPAAYVYEQLQAARRNGEGGEFANFAYAPIESFDYTPYVPAMQAAATSGPIAEPELSITTTTPPASTLAGVLPVQGQARGGLAIRRVSWSTSRGQTGEARLTYVRESGSHTTGWVWRMDWTADVTLEVGDNQVIFTVESIKGNQKSTSALIRRLYEESVAQQPATLQVHADGIADVRMWDAYVSRAARQGSLRLRRIDRDPATPSHVIERFQQAHRGVPIWGAEVVRGSDRGVTQWLFGNLAPTLTIATEPGLTVEMARDRLLKFVGTNGSLLRQPALVVLPLASGDHRLAYAAVIFGNNQAFRIFIDARSGVELLRHSVIHTQAAVGTGRGVLGDVKTLSVLRQAGVFVTSDQQRPPGLTTYDIRGDLGRALNVISGGPLFASDLASDVDNQWTDPAAVDAHAYIGWTYDYFSKRHRRRGLDDRDRPIVALINGVTQGGALALPAELFDFAINAFWCGECGPDGVGVTYFGNGIPPDYTYGGQTWGPLAGALDVVAHELTHAVTHSSSGLIYLNESGALNEAFSDIMGTSVEFFHQPAGAFRAEADFIIGEDTIRSPDGLQHGIRSLSNPGAFGHPDHYSIRYTGSDDQGGVHINAGIPNHAFYLAVIGGTNRTSGMTVRGVGLAHREQIEKAFYRAFVYMLPASATFSTARAATIQAARDLYGVGSTPELSITQAWSAVGVF